MKVKNITTNKTLYLADLRFTPQAQNEGRRGEDRYIQPGASVYLPNTSEVLRSVTEGTIKAWVAENLVELEDTFSLADAASQVLTHNFGYPQTVSVFKFVTPNWVDATGSCDVIQNGAFTTVTITNTSGSTLTFKVRLG